MDIDLVEEIEELKNKKKDLESRLALATKALEKIVNRFPEHGMVPQVGRMGHPDDITECEAQGIARKAISSLREGKGE